MPVTFRITKLPFQTGDIINIEPSDTILIVGPNNSGKTRVLQDIVSLLRGEEPTVLSTRNFEIQRSGSADDFRQFIVSSFSTTAPNTFTAQNSSVPLDHAIRDWSGNTPFGSRLAPVLVRLVTTEDRLSSSREVQNYDTQSGTPQIPLHHVFIDTNLEAKMSDAFASVFKQGLFLDRWRGSTVSFKLGKKPEGQIEWSQEHRSAVENCADLDDQGDGIRSFVGVLLELFTGVQPVILIDEPEAFLHPPQARRIGQFLAKRRLPGEQLIVASHSLDLLQGMTDRGGCPVRVLRLRRVGNRTSVTEVRPENLKKLWSDPIIRLSRLLDGIFHDGVVLCEGDADALFYEALIEVEGSENDLPPDLIFVPSGGKDRFPVMVRATLALGVPTAVVADFDILREKSSLKRLVEVLNGDWEQLKGDWKLVTDCLTDKSPPLSLPQVRERIIGILDEVKSSYLEEAAADSIRSAIRQVTPWAAAKDAGLNALPGGPVMEAGKRLLEELSTLGLFVVPCGELERWVTSFGGHGPQWVRLVLEHWQALEDEELRGAREFMRKVCDFLR